MKSELCVVLALVLAAAGAARACQCYPHEAKRECAARRLLLEEALNRDRSAWAYFSEPVFRRLDGHPDAPPYRHPVPPHGMPGPVPRYGAEHRDHFVAFDVRAVRMCREFNEFSNVGLDADHDDHLEVTDRVRVYCLIHTADWADAEPMARRVCWYPDCTRGDQMLEIDGPGPCPAEMEWQRLHRIYGARYGRSRARIALERADVWLSFERAAVPLALVMACALVGLVRRVQP